MSQDNIKCEAPAEQAGVENNSTCQKKNGEENQAKVASNTPSNRIEQDTSMVSTTSVLETFNPINAPIWSPLGSK